MFKDRAIQIKMVKSKPPGDTPTEETTVQLLDPDAINEIVTVQVKNVAIAVGAVLAGSKLLTTVSKIAVITAKAKIR